MTKTADVTISKANGASTYATSEGIVAAKVWRQGRYIVRSYISPDEYVTSEWATAEAAHNVALKHSLSI